MARQAYIRKKHPEIPFNTVGSRLRDFILGWQDGLVNVLGVVLAVAIATQDKKLVIIAALAAAFAESVSMAAVAYTSFKAEKEFYQSELAREKQEIRYKPEEERREVRDIYRKIGFREPLLGRVVKFMTSDKKRWLTSMMEHELKLFPQKVSPINTAIVVGISAIVGSFIPIIPFLLLPINTAVQYALVISTTVLFAVGYYKAKTTIGNPIKSGIEMAVIGMLAALIGYAIGAVLGVAVLG